MKLLYFLEKENYQPLERGIAFTQYYENGDKFDPHSNAFDWHHNFYFKCLSGGLGVYEKRINLMGGEL